MTSPAVPEGTAPNQGLREIDSLGKPGDIVDVAFFNAQDGVKGRDGGPYLDYEERYQAELRRAVLEDRDPVPYGENVPAHVGTTLVTSAFVVDNSSTSNPSMAHKSGLEQTLNQDSLIDTNGLADPISVLPVQLAGDIPVEEDNSVDETDVEPVDETDVEPVDETTTTQPTVTGFPGYTPNA